MTPDQLTAFFDGLSKILNSSAIPAVLAIGASIITLVIQNYYEKRRAESQRKWTVDDRDAQRAWSVEERNVQRKWKEESDMADEKRKQFLQYRGVLDEYIENVLKTCAYVGLKAQSAYPERDKPFQEVPEIHRAVEMSATCAYYANVIGDKELNDKLKELIDTLNNKLRPLIVQNPPPNAASAASQLIQTQVAAGEVTSRLNKLAVELLNLQSYK